MTHKRRKCPICGKELRIGQEGPCSQRCRVIAAQSVRRCHGIWPNGRYCEANAEPGRWFCADCRLRNEKDTTPPRMSGCIHIHKGTWKGE